MKLSPGDRDTEEHGHRVGGTRSVRCFRITHGHVANLSGVEGNEGRAVHITGNLLRARVLLGKGESER